MQNHNSKFKIFKKSSASWRINLSRRRSGFTLIEVLVAATIIGLLSTIGITGFQAITRSGRDAVRKSDLEQIRSALEIYKSENNFYPTPETTCIPALPASYINNYPSDPKSPTNRYCYNWLNTLQYNLCAHLENGGTTDYSGVTSCGGNNMCTTNCNYKVANP